MIIKLLFKTAPLLVFVSLMFLFGKAVYADDISCRLIVYSQEDDTVADDENLIAGYEDVYILQYDTSEEAEEALTYYNDSSAIAELDTSVNIAEGTSYSSSDPEMVMTEEDNPLTRLEELVDTADLQLQEYFDIARSPFRTADDVFGVEVWRRYEAVVVAGVRVEVRAVECVNCG